MTSKTIAHIMHQNWQEQSAEHMQEKNLMQQAQDIRARYETANTRPAAIFSDVENSGKCWRGILQAKRWSGAETIIRNIAWISNCRVRFDIDRGWLTHTYRFEIDGDQAEEAKNRIDKAFGQAVTP